MTSTIHPIPERSAPHWAALGWTRGGALSSRWRPLSATGVQVLCASGLPSSLATLRRGGCPRPGAFPTHGAL